MKINILPSFNNYSDRKIEDAKYFNLTNSVLKIANTPLNNPNYSKFLVVAAKIAKYAIPIFITIALIDLIKLPFQYLFNKTIRCFNIEKNANAQALPLSPVSNKIRSESILLTRLPNKIEKTSTANELEIKATPSKIAEETENHQKKQNQQTNIQAVTPSLTQNEVQVEPTLPTQSSNKITSIETRLEPQETSSKSHTDPEIQQRKEKQSSISPKRPRRRNYRNYQNKKEIAKK